LIKATCVLGFIPFFIIFIILWYLKLAVDIKISIYAVIILTIYYFIYDLFGEILRLLQNYLLPPLVILSEAKNLVFTGD